MFESRVAVYACGDERIFFPAVVALNSIKRQNPEAPFDYFISFSGSKITSSMRQELHKRDIGFIPREQLVQEDGVDFRDMEEGKWPTEIWDNWVAPLYFHSIGYEYALKVDYDVLCVSPYSLEEMFGATEVFRGVVMSVNLEKNNVGSQIFSKLELPVPNQLQDAPYCNVGVLTFNTERYRGSGFLHEYARVYKALRGSTPTVPLCEQAALSVMMASNAVEYGDLNPNYNVRIITRPPIKDDGRADIRNLHFITHNKPWLKPDYRWFDKYVPIGKTSMYLYRATWLAEAARDPLASEYLDFDPNDQLLQLGTIIKVLNAYV